MTRGRWRLWVVLLALSGLFAAVLGLLQIPAALLLGPMAAGIVLAASGRAAGAQAIAVPRWGVLLAQAAVGTMIAAKTPMTIFGRVADDWAIFLAGVVSVIVVAAWLGYSLAKRQVLPGTTAVWGSSPGAAQAMIFMAEAHGADMRLVAVMQYLRVGMVATGASLVARFAHLKTGAAPEVIWFPPLDTGLLAAFVVMGLGLLAARVIKLPAGAFLYPMIIGAALKGTGLLSPALPEWLLALAYAAIGWMIGLRFTREILRHAARALPRLALSVLVLLALCGGMAGALVTFAGIDPLTAYLATSPGGADSIAIIAAASHVDMGFVMAMQTLRFIVVLATGPAVARWVAARV